jgi:hypothetical protein
MRSIVLECVVYLHDLTDFSGPPPYRARLPLVPRLKGPRSEEWDTNLSDESFKWAIGDWPSDQEEEDVGKWTLEDFLEGLSGVTMALSTRHLEWSREEVEVFLIEVRKQAQDSKSHVYFQM